MKKLLCYLQIFFCVCSTYAQSDFKKVDENTKQTVLKEITANKTNTLSCDFVQEKKSTLVAEKAISKGKMYYQNPNSLRWEYITPSAMALIVHENDVAVKTAKGTNTTNTRMFKELANIIMSTIDGTGLNDSKNFSSEVFSNSIEYKVKLTPINKRIAAIYTSISLIINKQTKIAKSITLQEKNGDSMIIQFSNTNINKSIDSKLFITQ